VLQPGGKCVARLVVVTHQQLLLWQLLLLVVRLRKRLLPCSLLVVGQRQR
jgi:hypothetical protein